jgi:hypothetical protein
LVAVAVVLIHVKVNLVVQAVVVVVHKMLPLVLLAVQVL